MFTVWWSSNDLSSIEPLMKKLKEQIEKEKDLDIKQELKKGNIVEIIEDTMNY